VRRRRSAPARRINDRRGNLDVARAVELVVVGLRGQRNPLNHYDFYDVNGSRKVDIVDVNIVRANFNATGPTPPEDLIYDRSPGVAPWAPNGPDNRINVIDVNLVRAAFNDACAPPPP